MLWIVAYSVCFAICYFLFVIAALQFLDQKTVRPLSASPTDYPLIPVMTMPWM
jgi:hypothetical protein